MFGRIHQWSHLGLGFPLWEYFKLLIQFGVFFFFFFLLVKSLFRFPASYSVSFGNLYLWGNFPISSKASTCLTQCSSYVLGVGQDPRSGCGGLAWAGTWMASRPCFWKHQEGLPGRGSVAALGLSLCPLFLSHSVEVYHVPCPSAEVHHEWLLFLGWYAGQGGCGKSANHPAVFSLSALCRDQVSLCMPLTSRLPTALLLVPLALEPAKWAHLPSVGLQGWVLCVWLEQLFPQGGSPPV